MTQLIRSRAGGQEINMSTSIRYLATHSEEGHPSEACRSNMTASRDEARENHSPPATQAHTRAPPPNLCRVQSSTLHQQAPFCCPALTTNRRYCYYYCCKCMVQSISPSWWNRLTRLFFPPTSTEIWQPTPPLP